MAETAAAALAAVSATPVDPKLLEPEKLSAAAEGTPSGALMEPEIAKGVDTAHPAVDANPRAGQPKLANAVVFNDPTVPGHVQVARNLGLADDYDAPKADKKA